MVLHSDFSWCWGVSQAKSRGFAFTNFPGLGVCRRQKSHESHMILPDGKFPASSFAEARNVD